MLDWLKQNVWWLAGFSSLLFVVVLLVAVLFIVRMPADYFVRVRAPIADGRRSTVHWLRRVIKNIVGMILLLVGVLMSLPLVPGPGLLLILIGVSLMDFPGKRALEFQIVRNPLVLPLVNGLRTICRQRPLDLCRRGEADV